ncbi:MAG: YdcH family protein [Candidatus Competibacteraceae bacterium]
MIARLAKDPLVDELELKRLKKRKLMLKDMIAHLESRLIPDLSADLVSSNATAPAMARPVLVPPRADSRGLDCFIQDWRSDRTRPYSTSSPYFRTCNALAWPIQSSR